MQKDEYKKAAEPLKAQLTQLSQRIREANLPVIVVFEGYGASGKGSFIGDIIENLDPRGYKVYSTLPKTEEEYRRPLPERYWERIPMYGTMALFDRSWYREVSVYALEEDIGKKELNRRYTWIGEFERALTDDGYLIIKFFLDIGKKEQKRRFDELLSDKNTRFRVSDADIYQNKHYDRFKERFYDMLTRTDTQYAPWHVIAADNRYAALYEVYSVLAEGINRRLTNGKAKLTAPVSHEKGLAAAIIKGETADDSVYRPRMKELKEELRELHYRLYNKKRPLVIVFEGYDAAGKGGGIKRLVSALDPRGFEVVPVSAPDRYEINRHYLWRFWRALPKTGHITVFDRSWYGRVLVERVEQFCPEERWQAAYGEICEFERQLHDAGVILVKFFLKIDKDEQLRRFNERENTPEKRYKITEEDYRNRAKWDEYEKAVDDMLIKTSTSYSQWIVLDTGDKHFARLNILETCIKRIKEEL